VGRGGGGCGEGGGGGGGGGGALYQNKRLEAIAKQRPQFW